MKLATKAYILTLILLMLAFAAPAQRSEKDDRNTAPTVGTGGPVGGPTGLFTVYDSSTLRKGEYTFSIALSNYDRDPGNVDISSVPFSFQVGVTNRFELFAATEAYRGIKVNSPRNLSSFYLPNSQLNIGGVLRRPGAIVLEPGGGGRAIFRPLGAPFAQFPYTGAQFYSPSLLGTGTTLGPPRPGGAADLFPGVGSPVGGILPGFVLTTTTLANGAVVPASFSVAPSYLNDAPFINRIWGQTSFNTLEFGMKWRFNDSLAAWGHGLTAFYRHYLDKADDFGGFNQMQRGSGRGSDWGDIGVTYFIDGRATKWANVSFNAGYVYTSKIKGNFGGSEFTMLDPGDELHLAVGVDFPVNKHFQPILEFRSLQYVGGRTPNALEQNPYDGIAGFRVFPRRWFGFGLAYRYNFNQQDRDWFDDTRRTNAAIAFCPPGAPTACVPSTVSSTTTGIPAGLTPSSDPHGYIGQFWIGRRDARGAEVPNQPANVESVTLSDTVITLPCPPGTSSASGACNDSRTVSVATVARDPENDVLTYNYTVTGGRIVGTGANVQWDLSGVQAGTYTITTGVDDGCGICGRTDTQTIRIEECADCRPPVVPCPSCPTISIIGPAGITAPGQSMTFTATASGATSYNWTVSRGTITSGQGTPSITVSTSQADAGQSVTATVEVMFGDRRADCPACPSTASETAGVATRPEPSIVDEFGRATDDDIKARVDNFYIQLNNNPTARGYIINYGTPAQIRARRAQIMRAINFRSYDVSRVTFVDGPDNGTGIQTRFYLVPAGADAPNP